MHSAWLEAGVTPRHQCWGQKALLAHSISPVSAAKWPAVLLLDVKTLVDLEMLVLVGLLKPHHTLSTLAA